MAKESTNLPTEKSIQEIGCIKIVMDREPMGESIVEDGKGPILMAEAFEQPRLERCTLGLKR